MEDAKDELEQMKVREQLEKEMTLADMEYAQKGNKTSEQYIGIA